MPKQKKAAIEVSYLSLVDPAGFEPVSSKDILIFEQYLCLPPNTLSGKDYYYPTYLPESHQAGRTLRTGRIKPKRQLPK